MRHSASRRPIAQSSEVWRTRDGQCNRKHPNRARSAARRAPGDTANSGPGSSCLRAPGRRTSAWRPWPGYCGTLGNSAAPLNSSGIGWPALTSSIGSMGSFFRCRGTVNPAGAGSCWGRRDQSIWIRPSTAPCPSSLGAGTSQGAPSAHPAPPGIAAWLVRGVQHRSSKYPPMVRLDHCSEGMRSPDWVRGRIVPESSRTCSAGTFASCIESWHPCGQACDHQTRRTRRVLRHSAARGGAVANLQRQNVKPRLESHSLVATLPDRWRSRVNQATHESSKPETVTVEGPP